MHCTDSSGSMTRVQELVLTLEMMPLSNTEFMGRLFCLLQKTVLLNGIYIHYFGGFRYVPSLACAFPFLLASLR